MPAETISRGEFLEAFREEWRPDQHVSLIGPTGHGKSYTARQILNTRPGRVLILCPKGVDETFKDFGNRIRKWPPPFMTPGPTGKNEAKQWLLRLEPPIKKPDDMAKLRGYFAKALESTFRQQNWTVYVDELQVTSDQRMMNLGKTVEAMLLMGRSRNVSMVSSIQVPRWAPRAAYDQASHVLLWRQRDFQSQKRIGEISGVDSKEVISIASTLEFHDFLWVNATDDSLYIVGKD